MLGILSSDVLKPCVLSGDCVHASGQTSGNILATPVLSSSTVFLFERDYARCVYTVTKMRVSNP